MSKITLQDLQDKGACYWKARGERCHALAERVETNLPATLGEIMRWDWVPVDDREWVFEMFVLSPLWEAYEDARAPLWKAYEDTEVSLWESYGYAEPPQWTAYFDAEGHLRHVCEDARALLLKELTK
jgi:hypothetical protein